MARKLLELAPVWLIKDGRRVGFTFICPTDPKWRGSCFVEKTPTRTQWELFKQAHGEDFNVQGCEPDCAWTVQGGIETARFETISVTPSLDGSKGGLWHGFITEGEIR